MQIRCFTVGAFSVNTYLITDPGTGRSAIVDTGETDELRRALEGLVPAPDIRMILLTHAHLDHAGALDLLQERWDVPTYLPRLERPLFETLPIQGALFGLPGLDRRRRRSDDGRIDCGRIDHWLDDGDRVPLGETTLHFLSTPGHTPGQGCYFDEEDIIVGDTLFAGSIGRTDFPLSDPKLAVASLRRLLELPPTLRVHSGHGPVTTLGQELHTNPFLGYLRRERGIEGPPGLRWAPGT